jgi:gas vesicle protein
MSKSDNLKVVAALLAGAVAGTVLGLLFAPAKGTDTRKKALDGAKDLANSLKNKVSNNSLLEEGKEKIKELAGK